MQYLHTQARFHASTGHTLLAKSRLQAKRLGAVYHSKGDRKEDLYHNRASTTTSDDPFATDSSNNNNGSSKASDNSDSKSNNNVKSDDEIQAQVDAALDAANAAIQEQIQEAVDFAVVESAFYGVIDGLSSFLTNSSCTGGMANVVNAAFRMVDHIAIYDPRNTMKFTLASNNLTDATNIVSAYCDFSGLWRQLSDIFGNYRQWENYIRLAARVGGVFISDWQPNYLCISEGIEAGIGHDVGLCCSRLITLMLDSVL